jgi:hypothetical protein
MNEILGILGVAGLFILRVGLPVILLVGLGLLIDRWQTRRETDALARYKDETKVDVAEQDDDEQRKAA